MKYILLISFFLLSANLLLSQKDSLAISIEKGSKIYKKNCVACHTKKGTGKGKRIPPLAQSDYLTNNRLESIKGVKYGMKGTILVNGVSYNRTMKSMNLEDQEIADVMNYIMNSWGNTSDKIVTKKEVELITED